MTFNEIYELVQTRQKNYDPKSSTCRLLEQGVHAIGKKLVEEAAESWMAARYESQEELSVELSQVLYYVACMMVAKDVSLEEVYKKL